MANKRPAITGNVKLTKWDGDVLSGSVYTTALTMPSATKEAPETDVTIGLLGVDTQGRGRLDLTFGGTDANNETINYQVVGYRHSQANSANGFVPEKIAEGAVTLGTQTFGAGGKYIETAASLWADTITETLASGFASVYSPADDTMARLSIDVSPFIWVTVQVERGTAATANVVANLCDWIGGMSTFDADVAIGDVDLIAGGNAMTRLGTNADAAASDGSQAAQLRRIGEGVSPSASTGLVSVITSDAEWTSITLTVGALFADVKLTGDAAYMVCQTAEPADADTGCDYPPGIVFRIPTQGRTKIWIRRFASTDVRIRVTDYK